MAETEKKKKEKLLCGVCGKPIKKSQFRFKVWNLTKTGFTKERKYVHSFHITPTYRFD